MRGTWLGSSGTTQETSKAQDCDELETAGNTDVIVYSQVSFTSLCTERLPSKKEGPAPKLTLLSSGEVYSIPHGLKKSPLGGQFCPGVKVQNTVPTVLLSMIVVW